MSLQEDLHRILSDIESDVGVTKMGYDLKDALVESVVAEVRGVGEVWGLRMNEHHCERVCGRGEGVGYVTWVGAV